jgi:hypothetical protein
MTATGRLPQFYLAPGGPQAHSRSIAAKGGRLECSSGDDTQLARDLPRRLDAAQVTVDESGDRCSKNPRHLV